MAFKIPYVYDYITKLCRTQAEVTLNHVNSNVRAIGQETIVAPIQEGRSIPRIRGSSISKHAHVLVKGKVVPVHIYTFQSCYQWLSLRHNALRVVKEQPVNCRPCLPAKHASPLMSHHKLMQSDWEIHGIKGNLLRRMLMWFSFNSAYLMICGIISKIISSTGNGYHVGYRW
jgi:hypothetical protein